MVDIANLEKGERGKIEFPPSLTQALGSYLNQEIAPQLARIGEGIRNLPKNSKGVEAMENGRKRIEEFLNSFEEAEKVTLAMENGLADKFEFSGQRKEKTLKPGVITADQTLTRTLVNGLDHVIRNPLNPLIGRSEDNYPEIYGASSRILQVMELFNHAQELKITIDSSGRSTLTIIPNSPAG